MQPPPPPLPMPPHDSAVADGQESQLRVEVVGAACAATRRRVSYPLKLAIPHSLASFAPARGAAAAALPSGSPPLPVWAIMLGFGGGLVAADCVALSVRVEPSAALVLTTQASTKVYHSRAHQQAPAGAGAAALAGAPAFRPAAVFSLAATVSAGSLLVVAPDPVVCFADAALRQAAAVVVHPQGSLLLLDWLTAGRTARGERWAFRSYESRTTVWVAGGGGGGALVPVVADGTLLQAWEPLSVAQRMGSVHCTGSLILLGPRLADYALRLLRDLAPFTRACLRGGRSATAPADGGLPAAEPQPLFMAAGGELPGGGGAFVRFTAEDPEAATAWVRAVMQPLEADMGGSLFRM